MGHFFSRMTLSVIAAATLLFISNAWAQEKVRIGVLNDQSGVFATYQGIGSVLAAQMAVEDYGGKAGGKPVEVVSADHQNKLDVGVGIARRWFENESVDAIFDLPNSAIALAVAGMSEQKNKVFVGSGAGTALLTGEKCTPNTVHWTYDTYAYGRGLGKAVVAQGGKKWFFITADYAFGHDLEKQAAEAVKASGGEVVGAVRHPLGTADYASYLLQAQASGADIVGIANAGDDTITSMKQAAEFGLTKKQRLIGLILGMNGLPALTLQAAQGAQIMNPFYWDLTEGTRSFAKRFSERHSQNNYPNDMQAGVYASVIHYLKAVDKVGGAVDGKAIVVAMKAIPTDDALFGRGYIRADGRKIHPLYLLQVKKPDESKSKWDLLRVVATIPGEDAFRPEKDGAARCRNSRRFERFGYYRRLRYVKRRSGFMVYSDAHLDVIQSPLNMAYVFTSPKLREVSMSAASLSPSSGAGNAVNRSSDIPRVDVDPFSIEFFDDPYPTHELLRETGPLVYLDKWKVFAVARYGEVHAVLNNPLTFCSGRGAGINDFAKETPWRPQSIILEADPPAHTRTRGVLSKVLSPTIVKTIRDGFTAAAVAKVDELLTRKCFDGIADLAEAYPMSVFPDAMGLKQEGRENLLPYAGLVFNAFGPPNKLRQDAIERSAPHQAYVAEQCQRSNLAPGGFGACIHARADAGDITEAEAPLLVRSLLSAGIDTTVNGIGAAIYCLARFPDQLARLRHDPSLARNAFEEAIRFESPVQTFFRTTTCEVEIGGYRIGEGEKVLMFLGAANRDPRRWDNPDSYDITRKTSGHVGFGSGIHMCVGQLVARLEGEVMLAALARKVAAIEISGPIKRRYNNTLRGLESLPLTLTPA